MSIRHFNIAICQENGEIIKNNKYLYNVYDGTMVHFDHSHSFNSVEATPLYGAVLIQPWFSI